MYALATFSGPWKKFPEVSTVVISHCGDEVTECFRRFPYVFLAGVDCKKNNFAGTIPM